MALSTGSETSDNEINNNNDSDNETPNNNVEDIEARKKYEQFKKDLFAHEEEMLKRPVEYYMKKTDAWLLKINELAKGYPETGSSTYQKQCERVGYAIGAYGENEEEEEEERGNKKLERTRFVRWKGGEAVPDCFIGDEDICKEFNKRTETADLSGQDLGVVIKLYDDGTHSFTFGPYTRSPTALL